MATVAQTKIQKMVTTNGGMAIPKKCSATSSIAIMAAMIMAWMTTCGNFIKRSLLVFLRSRLFFFLQGRTDPNTDRYHQPLDCRPSNVVPAVMRCEQKIAGRDQSNACRCNQTLPFHPHQFDSLVANQIIFTFDAVAAFMLRGCLARCKTCQSLLAACRLLLK